MIVKTETLLLIQEEALQKQAHVVRKGFERKYTKLQQQHDDVDDVSLLASSASSTATTTRTTTFGSISVSNNRITQHVVQHHVSLSQLQQLHQQERELAATLERVQEMANDLEARSYELRIRADSIVNLAVDRIQIHYQQQQQA